MARAGPTPSGILTKTDQGLFVSDPADMFVGAMLRNCRAYDTETLHSLERLIGPDSRLLIVGAHIGALLVPLAKRSREALAYEANPKTFRFLTINIELNQLDHCRAFNLAAGEKKGEIAFYANSVNSGQSKRKPLVENFAYTYDSPEVLTVPMVALDEHIEDHDFDLIVMDIEGSEYFALLGMQDILAHSRRLQMEFFSQHLDDVSGVSNAALLELLSPHFGTVRTQPDGDEAGRADFLLFLERLRDVDFEGDLLFSK